ncbi:acyl carrier protein [Thermodesulfobacteriota bacterium]
MVKDKIKKYIIDNFMNGDGSIGDDDQLFESGIIDSIGFIKLLAYIESSFNIPLDISEFTIDSGSINGIMQLVNDKMK